MSDTLKADLFQLFSAEGLNCVDTFEKFVLYSRILLKYKPTEFRVLCEFYPHENKYKCDCFNNYTTFRYFTTNVTEIHNLFDSILTSGFNDFIATLEKIKLMNQLP